MATVLTAHVKPKLRSAGSSRFHPAFVVAWLFSVLFYFMQYVGVSAPSVMVPELTTAFNLTTLGVSSLLGLYYYTYSAFSIVAGAALDRWGAKYTIPIGVLLLATGMMMFGLGISWAAGIGRMLQGAGSALGFIGAVYLAGHGFPSRHLATAVGITQCFGMLGGSAGQFVVAPLVHGPISWQQFWLFAGIIVLAIAVALVVVTPRQDPLERSKSTLLHMFTPYKTVLRNPQSYLCGLCSGLLFLPTTVGDMIWGVSFLRDGWQLNYAEAVDRASIVPLGWVFGAPVLGFRADYVGRRKPVLLGGIALSLFSVAAILYLPLNTLPPYVLGFLLGFGSSAASIPYIIIKEVNPEGVSGSATGAVNFLVFVISAFAAPAFGWFIQKLADDGPLTLHVFEKGDSLLVAAVAIAAILAGFLRETGPAAHTEKSI
ncbi:Sugar phosphate permease [Bradyrhizobium lablabi]|uniref:Lysosomal dipeptide transporter MFSD1 n=2 Tax=Bradyrhizobium TaxID=374 RepID=A0ABY0PEZ3_9BRAD|nr:Sugar phosphate permease [Bradyrhizobium ottawaense]SED70950.1 Sugar phosphate permease [Bradyrhizobium lablabi]SHL67074.1 Sugar phosphate permease [Bradyrhizobium lablabi]